MKKNFKLYVIIWALLLGLFNALAFAIPAWPTLEKFTASFWIGYGVATVAFIGQLICAWISFNEKSAKKIFYNISLITLSFAGLIAIFVVALICMIVTPLPYWVAAIACAIVLLASVIAVSKAKFAVNLVNDVDKEVETATSFIYDMREESESLLARAKTDETKAVCKNIRDAFKFSDPMSNKGLENVELEIKNHFALLGKAMAEGKNDAVNSEAEELLALISERNNKCKRLK